MRILVTGAAGFIGFHLVKRLLETGTEVVGVDNVNDYYDPNLKWDRLAELGIEKTDYGMETTSAIFPRFRFLRASLEEESTVPTLFGGKRFDVVVHLAAQAGVRYSLVNPMAYIQSNMVGFARLLEGCRHSGAGHLVYASSSSVYGLNETQPFSVHDNVDHPVSLYAASKKSNELMAHCYSHLYHLPATGLRFFTVYGPWGRPDMALFLFTRAMKEGKPIRVFNHGQMVRDFTYIDDIVEGVMRVIGHPPTGNPDWSGLRPDPSSSPAPWRIYNIGNHQPVPLMSFIQALEEALGLEAKKEFMDMQPGDVPSTFADVSDLVRDIGYQPSTPVKEGIRRFVAWYNAYYRNGDKARTPPAEIAS
ncbi:MAG: NAD-dependent epimerase [Saprospiraceae bacterium]|nr:NAD-dependent epimerase [Saprospiraceae bacterium]